MLLLARDYMLEEPNLHPKFYQRDVSDGTLSNPGKVVLMTLEIKTRTS